MSDNGQSTDTVVIPAAIIKAPHGCLHTYAHLKACADRDEPLPRNGEIAKATRLPPAVVGRACVWLRQEGFLA